MTHTYDMLMRNGRLGNQLWQIASTVGLARAVGDDVFIRPDWEYRDMFETPPAWFRGPATEPITDGGTLYLQELHLFERVEQEVVDAFTPQSWIDEFLGDKYPSFFEDITPKCSVHVRRGDYLEHPELFTPLCDTEYYQDAMKMVIDRLFDESPPEFWFFSDDIAWCRRNMPLDPLGRPCHFVEGIPREVEMTDRVRQGAPRDWEDFMLMWNCDYHIISNSTFSWWAAYLSGGVTAYPSRWYEPAMLGPDGLPIPWRLMIPEDERWMEIPC